MLKKLAMLAFLLAIAQQLSPGQAPQSAGTRPPEQIVEAPPKRPAIQQRGFKDTPSIVEATQSDQVQKETGTNQRIQPNNANGTWGLSDKIAAIASISAFLQFVALVVTICIMIRNGHRQLRAYVVVERGIIANVTDPIRGPGDTPETVARIIQPQTGPAAQITIKNTGQTPAYDVVHWGEICVREFPLTSQLPGMPTPRARFWSVIGPAIAEVKTLKLPRRLTEEETLRLREGSMAIYCHGEIHYRDAFKKRHSTHYRVMYCAIAGAWIGVGTDLTVCEEGNHAN